MPKFSQATYNLATFIKARIVNLLIKANAVKIATPTDVSRTRNCSNIRSSTIKTPKERLHSNSVCKITKMNKCFVSRPVAPFKPVFYNVRTVLDGMRINRIFAKEVQLTRAQVHSMRSYTSK